MNIIRALELRKCRRKGHDWFPNAGAREFVATIDICMRCGKKQSLVPWGECLGVGVRHELSSHYILDPTASGYLRTVPYGRCPSPQ